MEAEIYENLKIGIRLIEKNPDAARGHTLINTTWVYITKLKDQHDMDMVGIGAHRSNGTIEIVRVSAGFGKEFPGKIFLLGVILYGLVEAVYRWYMELCSGMEELGCIRGNIESSVWHKVTPSGPIYVAVHVDDGVMGGF